MTHPAVAASGIPFLLLRGASATSLRGARFLAYASEQAPQYRWSDMRLPRPNRSGLAMTTPLNRSGFGFGNWNLPRVSPRCSIMPASGIRTVSFGPCSEAHRQQLLVVAGSRPEAGLLYAGNGVIRRGQTCADNRWTVFLDNGILRLEWMEFIHDTQNSVVW